MTAEKLHDALNLLPGDLIAAADKVRSQPRKARLHRSRWAAMAACLAVILFGGWVVTSGLFSAKSTEAAVDNSAAATRAAAECEEARHEMQAAGVSGGETGNAAQEAPDAKQWDAAPAETETSKAAATEARATAAEPEDSAEEGSDAVWKNAATQYCLTPANPSGVVNRSAEPRFTLLRSREELDAYYEKNKDFYDLESFHESLFLYDDAWFAENDLLLIAIEAAASEDDSCYLGPEITGLTRSDDGSWALSMTAWLCLDHAGAGGNICCHILADIQKDVIDPEDTITITPVFD